MECGTTHMDHLISTKTLKNISLTNNIEELNKNLLRDMGL